MTFHDGRVTARVSSAPLRTVMTALSRLSGVEVRWMGQPREEPVSFQIDNLPLAEALGRILKTNLILTYAPGGRSLVLVGILPAGEVPVSPEPVPTPTSAGAPEQGQMPGRRVAEDSPSPAGARTAVSLDTITTIAQNAGSPASRLEALKVLAAVAQEPRVREVLAEVAETDGDPEVREAASRLLR
jgi:hypothetical protein